MSEPTIEEMKTRVLEIFPNAELFPWSERDDIVGIAAADGKAKCGTNLAWLADKEADLVTHREPFGDGGYSIWWNVMKGGKSISGHPLGSPQAAIEYAMNLEAPSTGSAEEVK